jgi:hypothetical protein
MPFMFAIVGVALFATQPWNGTPSYVEKVVMQFQTPAVEAPAAAHADDLSGRRLETAEF